MYYAWSVANTVPLLRSNLWGNLLTIQLLQTLTPLMHAAKQGNQDMAKILVAANAHLDAKSKKVRRAKSGFFCCTLMSIALYSTTLR